MTYLAAQLPGFLETCRRQRPKDQRFLPLIIPYFCPGEVLEIGAGCGQLAELLARRGLRVTASDLESFFVQYQESRGLKSRIVDATDILSGAGRQFDNILTQGVTTLVTNDLKLVERTYRSVWTALRPGGRFIFVFPNAYSRSDKPWSRMSDHWPIIERVGFRRVAHFRNQVFPSKWYHFLPSWLTCPVEWTIGARIGLRNVLVLEKPRSTCSTPGASMPKWSAA